MKIAVIGLGYWGKVLLGEFKQQVDVKYECDSNFDLNRVWNDPEIQAVAIATPTTTHFEIANQAFDADKHVFMEKPGTDSVKKLEKLVKKAGDKNLKLAIGYEYPHHPAVQKVKELTNGKKINFVRLEYQKWGTFKDSITTNLLGHDISILKSLGLDTSSPKANKVSVVTNADILVTRFGDKAMSVINRVSPIKLRTALIKSSNKTYMWSNNELFKIVGENIEQIELPSTRPVASEIKDFLLSITENREPYCNGEFALEIYKVIEQI